MNLRALFSLRGRESRLNYWRLYLLINLLVTVVWVGGLFAIIGLNRWAGLIFIGFAPLAAMAAGLVVRRVHDRGLSAVWAVLFVFGPLILLAPVQSVNTQTNPVFAWLAVASALLGYALSFWGLIEIGFRRGTAGPNRFGPDPGAAAP